MTTLLNSSKLIQTFRLCNKILTISNQITELKYLIATKSNRLQCLRCSSLPFVDLENINVEAKLSKIVKNVQGSGVISKTDVEKFLKDLKDDDPLDSTQLTTLLNLCGSVAVYQSQKLRQKIVDDIWDKFKSNRRVPLDSSHYNALLQIYHENEHDFDPAKILLEMEEYKISPTTTTYENLFLQYCKKGNIAEAEKLLQRMNNEHIPKTENVFNYLITGYAEAGDMAKATHILNEMSSHGIRQSAETYAALLYAYAKLGDIDNMRNRLDECTVHNITISKRHLFNIVYMLAANGHSEHVNLILILVPQNEMDRKEYFRCIIKLIDNGLNNVAYTVFKSIPRRQLRNGDLKKTGLKDLMEKLVFCNMPVKKLISFCRSMADDKLDRISLKLAVDIYLKNGFYQSVIPLLEALKDCGGVLVKNSVHSFCIRFNEANDENERQQMLNTIEEIIRVFGIAPHSGSIKHYILPHLTGDPQEIMSKLIKHRISYATAANALLPYLLEKNQIQDAKNFLLSSKKCIKTKLLRKPLVDAFINTKDIETFVSILKFQYNVLHNKSELVEEDDLQAEQITGMQYIDACVSQCMENLPENQDLFISLLNKLVLEGLPGISPQTAQNIEETLSEDMTPAISKNVKSLTCESLMSIPSVGRVWNKDDGFLNVGKLRDEIPKDPTLDIKPQISTVQYVFRNKQEATDALMKLQNQNVTIKEGLCAKYISIYCTLGDMEKAEYWMNKLKEISPEPELDRAKILSYAILLVENNRIKDALDCLSMTQKDKMEERVSLSSKLLNAVAETGNLETVDEFFHVLQSHQYFAMVKQDILRSFVKVRLIAGRTEDALDKFEWACKHYKMTPYKYELMVKFIKDNDPTSLLRITNQLQELSGEDYVLFDLAVSFLKCAQFKRAERVIENLNLKSYQRGMRMLAIANKFFENGEIDNLEAMFKILKYKLTNREPMCLLLLRNYNSKNDLEKALSLWTDMEKDKVRPSEEFTTILTNLFLKNGQTVPTIYAPFQSSSFSISS